jgi:alkanesulfonate monooxygenase SsuD/methylene tetrahydromethanopterin reductase-like flavin-dependent oxidoreductase (luciferase family)
VRWNIVTSFGERTAKLMGLDNIMPHDERYAAADEYMDLVYQLVTALQKVTYQYW